MRAAMQLTGNAIRALFPDALKGYISALDANIDLVETMMWYFLPQELERFT